MIKSTKMGYPMFLMNLASSSPLTLDKDLFKKFHTKEGLRLANQETFKTLQEVDKSGEYWKEPEYENIFGYKKPKKSAKAFELLTRIESESQVCLNYRIFIGHSYS